jgi:UDP-glucose 4-epimerase
VLVTGGLGFLGQAVARRLLAQGTEVDVLTSSNGLRAKVPPGAGVVRADLRDRSAIGRVIRETRYDGVCHLAALAQARDSVSDPVGYFDVNVTGTLNLLHALERQRCNPDRAGSSDGGDSGDLGGGGSDGGDSGDLGGGGSGGGGSGDLGGGGGGGGNGDGGSGDGTPVRLVFSSTGAVYGLRDGTLDEGEPPLPANPYGASKLAAEQVIGYQAAAGRLAAISLRCFNIAGAVPGAGLDGTDRDLTRIIPKTFAVAAGHADRLEINGDGSAIREYTHVLDVAEAVVLALDAAVVGTHRVYNVGSGQGVSLAQILSTARTITGRPVPAVHRPQKPEAQILTADSSRIRRELGWQPTHSSLDEILRSGWGAISGETPDVPQHAAPDGGGSRVRARPRQ